MQSVQLDNDNRVMASGHYRAQAVVVTISVGDRGFA